MSQEAIKNRKRGQLNEDRGKTTDSLLEKTN